MSNHAGPEREATAREIIETIVTSMTNNLEPMYTRTLAPGLFHVHLREKDHERLKGIFTEMSSEAEIALDERIALLNKSARRGLLPLINKLYRMVKPRLEQIPEEVRPSLTGKVKLEGPVARPRDGWQISFFRNEDPNSEPGDIAVDAILVLPAKPELGVGMTTKSLRTLFRAGATSVKTAPDSGSGSSIRSGSSRPLTTFRETVATDDRSSGGPQSAGVYAVIRYRDNDGEKIYEMKKDSIVIGRGGTGVWTDIKLDTQSDVSQEHARIRWNAEKGRFEIKDLSTFGTSIDGRSIPSSMQKVSGRLEDKDIWVHLPERSRINLAEVVTLEFDARREVRYGD